MKVFIPVHFFITMHCIFFMEKKSFSGIKILTDFTSLRLFIIIVFKITQREGRYLRLKGVVKVKPTIL